MADFNGPIDKANSGAKNSTAKQFQNEMANKHRPSFICSKRITICHADD